MDRIEATLLRLTKIGLLALGGGCRSAEIAKPSAQLTPALYSVELVSSRDTGPEPTAETLNAALMRLDESRAYDGDDLFFGQTLVVAKPLATNASPYRQQLDAWVEQLRHAAPMAAAEVGNVPAIQIHSALLR